MIEFDPAKDEANVAKHGVSLALAAEFEIHRVIEDDRRDYGERRFRAFGLVRGIAHCLVFTQRGQHIRAISLRRAHRKEMMRYVPT